MYLFALFLFDRVLSEVNFEKRFAELPEYTPKCATPPNVESTPQEREDSSHGDTCCNKSTSRASARSSSPAGAKAWRTNNDNLDALADAAAGVGNNQEGAANNGLKRNMDHKRNLVQQFLQQHGFFPTEKQTNDFLVEHSDVFPSKSNLQLKIREVRQKFMQR